MICDPFTSATLIPRTVVFPVRNLFLPVIDRHGDFQQFQRQ